MRALLLALCCLTISSATQDEGWVTHDVVLSPDLKRVVLGKVWRGSFVVIRDAEDVLHEVRGPSPVREFAFSPDSSRVFATNDNGAACPVYDIETGEVVLRIAGHTEGWVTGCAYSPDGERIATCGEDETVRLWDSSTGEEIWRATLEHSCNSVAFSLDGTRLAAGDNVGRVLVLSMEDGRVLRTHDTPLSICLDVVFGPEECIAAASWKGRVVVLADGATQEMAGHEKRTYAIRFTGDGKILATTGADNKIRLWNPANGKLIRTIDTKLALIDARFSPDETEIVGVDYDGAFHRWKVRSE